MEHYEILGADGKPLKKQKLFEQQYQCEFICYEEIGISREQFEYMERRNKHSSREVISSDNAQDKLD